METLVLTIAPAAIGIVIAVRLRRDRVGLLRLAGIVMLLLAAVILALAVTGWPIFRARVRGLDAGIVSVGQLRPVHNMIGRQSLLAVTLFAPVFVAAALCHARGWRRNVHLCAAVALVALWVFGTIAGYILPRDLRYPIPRELVPGVLRFAVLHVFLIPASLCSVLVLVGYRHLRYGSGLTTCSS